MVEMGLGDLSSQPFSQAGCWRFNLLKPIETYSRYASLMYARAFSAGGVLAFSARTV